MVPYLHSLNDACECVARARVQILPNPDLSYDVMTLSPLGYELNTDIHIPPYSYGLTYQISVWITPGFQSCDISLKGTDDTYHHYVLFERVT